MLTQYESRDDFKKIAHSSLFFSLFVFFYGTYVLGYPILKRVFFNSFFTALITKIHSGHPNPFLIRLFVIAFAIPTIFTFSPSRTIPAERKKLMFQGGIIFFTIYLFSCLFDFFHFYFISIMISCVSYGFGLYFFIEWKKKVAEDLKKDRRQEEESQFDQLREEIQTEHSVNIPYSYSYLGERLNSWINIVNPFRGVLIGGTPGSGKSFAILEEMMRQFTRKGFTGVVYDFKYPTLTKKQYNYFRWYNGMNDNDIPRKFYVINFDDPEYSHRCNPINVDTLQTISDAEENTKVLMMNINKTWVQKEGDFFVDSANLFTAILMWYLKIVTKKYDYDICSFPHLVALSTFESREILFMLFQQYDDLKAKMTPFNDAIENGALEQLAGQTASAGVALAKISSPELNYILTGDDFSLDLNSPLAPKILCLGNNPDRQTTYSAPLGLILSKLTKTLNSQGNLPSMFCIDEFPTIYIRGVDNLIGTGRSNKISTILGFQTLAQVVADYGKETADKIIRLCGSRIMGQMMDEDAKMVSETIGKQKVLSRSYNYSTSDVSENQQVAMEDIVPSYRISQFSQGTFCGVIADDFKYKESNKVFYGEVTPPLKLKKMDEDIPLPKITPFIPENLENKHAEYKKSNEEFLKKIKECFLDKTIMGWNQIITDTTTERRFDDFLIEKYKFDYEKLKTFSSFVSLKKNINKWIRRKRDNLLKQGLSPDVNFTEDELNTMIDEFIEQGFINEFKNNYLINHQKEIYNDVYRIIAMEVVNLNLLDFIATTKEPKNLLLKTHTFFQRLSETDRYDDKEIKRDYKELSERAKELSSSLK